MTTLNDILNAPTVNTALALANAYAMTEYGLMGNAKTQFVNENFPELVRQSELIRQGVLDNYGNIKDDPNYSTLTSMNNPTIAEVPAVLDGGYTQPPAYDTATGILSEDIPQVVTSMEELNQIYLDELGRPFTDGTNIFNIYNQMSPADVRAQVYDSPEAQLYRQGGDDLTATDRAQYFAEAEGGLLNTTDSNQDGVVNMNDLLFDMGQAGIGDPLPVFNPVNQTLTPTSNLNTMPTNLTGQFYGMNPTTNVVELMSNMNSNPVFRSGVAGFTNQLPTGFEFGTPKVYRGISSYTPETFEEFVKQKEAEEAEAKKNRYTFTGMGSDFDQARLNETYTDS